MDFLRKMISTNKNLFGVLLLAIMVPVTVALIMFRQDIRQRAGGGQIITKLAFQPAIIDAPQNSKTPIPMSVLAYDQAGQPIGDGVSYSWGISSTNTVGTLSSVSGAITTFTPLNNSHGDIYVTATNLNGSLTGSMPVNIGNVTTTPTISVTPQPGTGEIRGMYVGQDGFSTISLPGQKVTVVNDSTGFSQSTTASPQWSFTNLPEGTYSIFTNNISGYTIQHQVCFGCLNQDRFFTGNTFGASVNHTRYLGVTFKYTPLPTGTLSKTGDVNGDNLVDLTDLSMLLTRWKNPIFSNTDFNKDGSVNLTDLSILLSNWGK